MEYRKFGKTDLQVSEIGFGTWAIGGNAIVGGTPIGWGKADDETSKKAIASAIEAGINFFDTADFYGLGHSEKLLGEALKRNTDIIIATKLGHRNINDAIVLDYSKKYIAEACEESLKRLQRETIDYYQLHSARLNHLKEGECIEAMQKLKKEGKIRYWGLSLNTFHPQPEADFFMKNNLGDGFQLVYNIINQRAHHLINQAGQKGYGIIARMPLQFGLLTGKFSPTAFFTPDDHRSFRLTPDVLQSTLSFLEDRVWPVNKEEQLNETGLALSFILSNDFVHTLIPGIRTTQQVQQNTAGYKKLSEKSLNYLLSLAGNELKPIMDLVEKAG